MEKVVLIHGLASHPLVLGPLARRLRGHGLEPLNWGYRSIRFSIERHVDRFLTTLTNVNDDGATSRFHIVAHSMGGIIARMALAHRSFGKLGRIVLLGPPNLGSHAARWLAPWLGGICPPLWQLSDARDSLVRTLNPPSSSLQVGVIAASRDRVVRVANTRLGTELDHLVLPTGHTSMLFRTDLAQYVAKFLREGRFSEQLAPATGSYVVSEAM